MSNPSLLKPQPIRMLTGLRFVLATYVVLYHFSLPFFVGIRLPYLALLSAGYSAVSMFFALSGYLLAFNYADGLPVPLWRFWISRAARLLPAFLVSQFIIMGSYSLYLLSHHSSLKETIELTLRDAVVSFSFLQAWFYPVANAPAWSLSCEVFFYCLFPFIVVPIAKLTKIRMERFCIATALSSLIFPCLYLMETAIPIKRLTEVALVFPTADQTALAWRYSLWHGNYRFFLFLPIVHLPIFVLGVGFGCYRRRYFVGRHENVTRSKSIFSASAAALIAVLLFSAQLPHLLLHDSVVGILFSLCLITSEGIPRIVRSILETKVMVFLGEASYAEYILQIPFFGIWSALAKYILHKAVNPLSPGTPAFVVGLIVFSAAVFKWIEQPAGVLIRKWGTLKS